MAVLVVGGSSRSVGKTSVVAGLIRALADRHWTAVKITQFGHGICSNDGHACSCAVNDPEHPYAINEERNRSGDSDTSRFLRAGAARSLWVRTRQGFLAQAIPELRRELEAAEDVIIESNSILRFVRPDLYITVLDPNNPDFKSSSREYLDRADAIILDQAPGLALAPQWAGVSLKPVAGKPVFRVHPPEYVTADLLHFVRERLAAAAVHSR